MRLLTAVGVAAVLGGFLVLFDRGFAGLFELSTVAVTLVGALGVVQGIRYASARRGRDRTSLTLGDPERRARASVPGDDVDDLLVRAAGTKRRRYELRQRLRARVRTVAVAELARTRNCPPTEADDLVAAGAWTANATAAAFLADDVAYPMGRRLRARLLGQSLFQVGFVAAVDAVGALAASDDLSGADGERDSAIAESRNRREETAR